MQAGVEIEGLKRIVALLFALADLADRAGVASRSMRRTVLGILWPAEAVAREFVTGLPLGFDATGYASDQTGVDSSVIHPPRSAILSDDRAEAARLASSFRTLALLLAFLLTGMRNPRRARRVLCPGTVPTIIGTPCARRRHARSRDPPRRIEGRPYAAL